MKVLHCSTEDIKGGAAIAAHRLHFALNKHTGINSYMGVQFKHSHNEQILKLHAFKPSFLQYIARRTSSLSVRLHGANHEIPFTAYLWPNFIANAIKKIQPDIIHLHWISQFISPWTLKQIGKLNIPVVWTLHDTWAFTGGCHYYGVCSKWQSTCRSCPHIKNYFWGDFAHTQWKFKHTAYSFLSPTIIALSNFFEQDIKNSSLLKPFNCVRLPNTIDTELFTLTDKNIARQKLGLKQGRKYILFGAISATHDSRKGYDLLSDALNYLPKVYKDTVHCLIFGASKGKKHSLPTIFLGRIECPEKLALAYAAADVFVCPSREENLPNTIMESLACGTTVVGFDIGGIPDMVSHKENGYLATPYDTKDLAYGITYILEDDKRRKQMSKAARKKVEENYAYPVVVKQYIKLYEDILAKHKK